MLTNGLGRAVSRMMLGCVFLGATATPLLAHDHAEKISPRVDTLLKQMGATLQAMSAFSFTARISSDNVTAEGEKIETNRQTDFVIVRPGRLKGKATGGPQLNRSFVYDGKMLTILDHAAKVYSATEVPDTIDAMLDHVYEEYDISVPTADFLYSDVYAILTGDVQSSRVIGETELNGRKCHQLAVRLGSVDYQIWIADGDKPLPVRMVLTYKEAEGTPQFRIDFSDWKPLESAQIPEFKLNVPATYSKVKLEGTSAPGLAPNEKDDD